MTGKPLESAAPPRQRRSTSAAALLLVLVVAVLLVAQARSAWTIGVAYRYALPLYEVMRLRYATVYDEHNPHRTRLNSFAHKRSLPEPGDHLVTTPNADTLYSLAVLDLSGGPVRLEVPDTAGRYYSAALLDAYTNNFSIISRRTTGARGHSFIIVGPGWERAEPPDGAQLIHSPTATALLLLRILVDGPQDLPAVRQLQDGFRLGASPLKEAGTPPRPVAGDAGSFVAVVNQALADSPPPAADAAMLKRIAKAGIAPGAGEPDPALSAQWSTYLPLQQKLLAWLVARPRHLIAGWSYPPADIGNFGTDYEVRAGVALAGLLALPPEEAMYSSALRDARGEALDGTHRYRLHLPPVPVDAFWSLTMYEVEADGRLFFADNPLHRYAVGDRTPGLRKNPDGSMDILIQQASPAAAAEGNWLPAPPGPFRLTMRAYHPRRELLEGRYHFPAVERSDDR